MSDLVRHILAVSIRHLKRSKTTAIINITGLAVSLTSFLFIAIYVINESTFDTLHPNPDQVYRISESFHEFGDGAEWTDARAPGRWALELKNAMPEIRHVTRMSRFGYPGTIRNEKRDLLNIERQFFWVDSTYVNIFALPMVSGGDPRAILRQPGKVIINQKMVVKYFGSEDPVGQSLIYSRDGLDIPLVVEGVMRNYPSNVHFHPDFITSNLALAPLWNQHGEINSSYTDGKDRVNSWTDEFTYSYIELSPGTEIAKVDKALRKILAINLGEDAKYVWPTFTKLTDIHFRQGMSIELESPGDSVYRYIFGSIGLLILLIACINYMNMATAKSRERSREVGLRKTLGVRRGSLIAQFLVESIVLSGIAVFLAIILVGLLLPTFRELTGNSARWEQLLTANVFLLLIGLTLVVGILSGSYPAFFLSGFKPLDVLKGKLPVTGTGDGFRRSLVVVQFTITLLLMVGTLVIQKQLSYTNESKLSEFKDQMMAVRLRGLANPRHLNAFGERVRRQSFVEGVAKGTELPRQDRFPFDKIKVKAEDKTYIWEIINMDSDFPVLFQLEFVAGRNFSANNPADSTTVIINESAAKDLHKSPEQCLGLLLEGQTNHEKSTVIGVVKDFNITSLRTRIEPLAIIGTERHPESMFIKLAGNNYPAAIQLLEKIWKETFPNTPFDHWFLNEEFGNLYRQERTTGTLFKYFAGMAIFIGCLGLFGLASFTVEQRTKEIGIRKVLGASGAQILVLITGRFVKLIVISLILGIPLSVYLMQVWLSRFAYPATIGWLIFAGSALFLLGLTCLTVCIESLKAALKNPVDAIRHE